MAKKKALITGIFGQDGSYLCELLTGMDYEVHGIIHNRLSENSQRIRQELNKNGILPEIHIVDLNNFVAAKDTILEIKPDEIYHLAASHVSSQGFGAEKQFIEKELFEHNITATSNILYISYEYLKKPKIALAGSCLMFDASNTMVQTEKTPFKSSSLYGLAKITENLLAKYYRSKGLYVSTAILYNHESPRRSNMFVTKKIVENMTAIKNGKICGFTLGSLAALKDWGFAKDYVDGMYLMARQDYPDDYIFASEELHSIREFVEICAYKLGLDDWERFINIDPTILDRKTTGQLLGDCSKAKYVLKWKKTVAFKELVELMLHYEINHLEK
jgi:GDPmannose 4,6-dehydratase